MVSPLPSSRSSSRNSFSPTFSTYLSGPCLRPCCCLLGFCFFSLILPHFNRSTVSSYTTSTSFSSSSQYYQIFGLPSDNIRKTTIRKQLFFSNSRSFLFSPYSFLSRKVDTAFHFPLNLYTTKLSFLSLKGSSSWKCDCIHSKPEQKYGTYFLFVGLAS